MAAAAAGLEKEEEEETEEEEAEVGTAAGARPEARLQPGMLPPPRARRPQLPLLAPKEILPRTSGRPANRITTPRAK